MKTEIIVASYKEPLFWIYLFEAANRTGGIIPDCKFIIYRTGDDWEGAIRLPNKGREAGQWLAHIVRNYDKLADVSLFVQADLAASIGFGASGNWPKDLNLLKSIRLPSESEGEGGIDDFSFYPWPSFQRIRCVVGEPGIREEHIKGWGPSKELLPPPDYVKHFWENPPDKIKFPDGNGIHFMAGQFMVTRNFIRRLPLAYYEKCLSAACDYELAHALEFGGWPTIIFDIFRQGPLRDTPPTQS